MSRDVVAKFIRKNKCFWDFKGDLFTYEVVIGAKYGSLGKYELAEEDIMAIAKAYDLECKLKHESWEGPAYKIILETNFKDIGPNFNQDSFYFFKSLRDIIEIDGNM